MIRRKLLRWHPDICVSGHLRVDNVGATYASEFDGVEVGLRVLNRDKE